MKVTFKISLFLNLLFGGGLVYLLLNLCLRQQLPAPSSPGTTGVSSQKTTAPILSVVPSTETKPFRWNQLEAADYHIYIRNLRTIGCPEPTLRAIVTSDVRVVYRQRGQELQQKLAALAGSSWAVQLGSYNEQLALKSELQQLPDEENNEIEDLLGLKSNGAEVASVAPALFLPSIPYRRYVQSIPIVQPLVVQNVDLGTLNFDEQQIEVVKGLQQDFVNEVGGSNQDPNDPAYQERWQNAQLEIDGRLRGLLGVTAYEEFQVAAEGSVAAPVIGNP